MCDAALASSDTTWLLPSLSPEGDSASTSAQVKASTSCWREAKCSRNRSIVSREIPSDIWLCSDRFLSRGQFLNSFQLDIKTNPGLIRSRDGSARTHGHSRLDDVFFPVPAAGGNITRQNETFERRHRNVVCAAY